MKDNNGIYKKYNIEWIGREGLSPETHEEYLNDFINHFYKVKFLVPSSILNLRRSKEAMIWNSSKISFEEIFFDHFSI